ncbi:MAG: hypothetical protein GXO83_11460 [Chlorobi bacterium]|nr:hypothetical protein [Chlorobiota bacterium]
MEEDFFGLYDEEQHRRLFREFEKMHKTGHVRFLDVAEFEELIDAYLDSGDYKKAGQAIDAAMTQHPATNSLKLLQADLQIRINKNTDALKILKYLESIEPDNPEIIFLLGVVNLRLYHYEKAFNYFARALKMDEEGDLDMAMRAGKQLADNHFFPQALVCFEQALMLYPGDSEVIYEIFSAWDAMGNSRMALQWIDNFLDEDPFSGEMWYLVATGALRIGHYKKALEAIDYAIALLPDQIEFYFVRARIMGKMKLTIEAEKYFHELVPDPLSDGLARLFISAVYSETGDFKKALRLLPPEILITEKYKDYLDFFSARIYLGLGREDIGSAVYESAIDRNTPDQNLLIDVYRYFRKRRKPETALKALERLSVEDPFRISFRKKIIDISQEIHPDHKIHLLYRQVLKDMPGFSDFHYSYAVFLIRTGEERKGLQFFRNGLILDFERHSYYLRRNTGLQDHRALQTLIEYYKNRKHEL